MCPNIIILNFYCLKKASLRIHKYTILSDLHHKSNYKIKLIFPYILMFCFFLGRVTKKNVKQPKNSLYLIKQICLNLLKNTYNKNSFIKFNFFLI